MIGSLRGGGCGTGIRAFLDAELKNPGMRSERIPEQKDLVTVLIRILPEQSDFPSCHIQNGSSVRITYVPVSNQCHFFLERVLELLPPGFIWEPVTANEPIPGLSYHPFAVQDGGHGRIPVVHELGHFFGGIIREPDHLRERKRTPGLQELFPLRYALLKSHDVD